MGDKDEKLSKELETDQQPDKKIQEESEELTEDVGKDGVSADIDDHGASNEEITPEESAPEKGKKKKGLIVAASIIGVLAVMYLGCAIFFMSHFYFKTSINGVDFSAKKVSDVELYMKTQVSNYTLRVDGINGTNETIQGSAIDMAYKPGKEIEKALKAQNPFLWITSFFSERNTDITIGVDYNKEKLTTVISGLNCTQAENQIASVSAVPAFDGTQFVITPEVVGTQVDIEKVNALIHEAAGGFRQEVDLEKGGSYLLPTYVKESPEVVAATDSMNKYLAASITYDMNPNTEIVDKTLIATWLSVDANMAVTFNKDAVAAYLDEFCAKYNTVGVTRSITTPAGKTAEVSGGIYGWKINRDKEYDALIANIEAGDVVTREPVYTQKAAVHGVNDWGSTYIEVDMSAQHMWYVSEGNVAFETDVVTGLPRDGRATPQGVNPILEKMRNKTLRGNKKPDGTLEYETPVEYWMRVTWSGIGFHDANWKTQFGGELYKSVGSHGCINMRPSEAAAFYGMISVGMPVIIHY